jgi:hypothetical protein
MGIVEAKPQAAKELTPQPHLLRARGPNCTAYPCDPRPTPLKAFINPARGILRNNDSFAGGPLLIPMSATQFLDSSATGDAPGTVDLQQNCHFPVLRHPECCPERNNKAVSGCGVGPRAVRAVARATVAGAV